VENRGVWIKNGWKYLSCFGAEKWLKIGGGGRRWCQVLEGICGGLVVIVEIKSPSSGWGFESVDLTVDLITFRITGIANRPPSSRQSLKLII